MGLNVCECTGKVENHPGRQVSSHGCLAKVLTCESIKMSGGLLGADQDIKVTSELLKIKGSRAQGCNLTFDPEN